MELRLSITWLTAHSQLPHCYWLDLVNYIPTRFRQIFPVYPNYFQVYIYIPMDPWPLSEKVRLTLQIRVNYTPVPLPFRSYDWIDFWYIFLSYQNTIFPWSSHPIPMIFPWSSEIPYGLCLCAPHVGGSSDFKTLGREKRLATTQGWSQPGYTAIRPWDEGNKWVVVTVFLLMVSTKWSVING